MDAIRRSVWQPSHEVFVVAEVGLNHNGRLENALALIDAAAEAGVQAVKFQKRDVETLATSAVLDSPDLRFPSLGKTYRELRETHEFGLEDFRELAERAKTRSLAFFVTPFDTTSLFFLEELGIDRYKVASHSVTNLPLLRAIANTRKPILLSTGMSSMSEVDAAVDILREGCEDLAMLHCVSSYPTEPLEARLDLIGALSERFKVPVGYSGHEIGFIPTLYAVAAGARIIERHLTLDNEMEGFDHQLSLNPEDFKAMVLEIRRIEKMFRGGPKEVTEKEKVTRDKYQVSMVSRSTILSEQVLSVNDVVFKNPGIGIAPGQMDLIIGKRAVRDIPADTILERNMFT